MRAGGTTGLVVAGAVLVAAVGLFGWIAAQGPKEAAPIPVAPTGRTEASPPARATESQPNATERVLADTRFGYRVTVPDGWRVSDHTSGAQLIRADLSSGDAGLQIRVMTGVREATASAFLSRYLERFVKEMEGHWGGRADELTRDCGVHGRQSSCQVGLVHHRAKGPAWFLKQYVWVRDGNAIVMQGGTLLEQRGQREPALDGVAASLTFE